MLRWTQSEARGEDLAQASVSRFGMPDHRGIRLQRNVDGRDRILLGGGRADVAEQRADCDGERGQNSRILEHDCSSSGGGHCSNAKMRFQSAFMLMIVQPPFFASSYRTWVKVPTLVMGSPSAGP